MRVTALLLVAMGCNKQAVRDKPVSDPLLTSKKPVEGRAGSAGPHATFIEVPPPPVPAPEPATLTASRESTGVIRQARLVAPSP
jgi:hypothetical protein